MPVSSDFAPKLDVHPWLRAAIALLTGVAVHIAFSPPLRPSSFWLALSYLAVLVVAAWGGYLPGLATAALIRFVIPLTVANGFAAGKLNWLGTATVFGISLGVSYIGARMRRSQAMLREQIRSNLLELGKINIELQRNLAELELLYTKLPVGLCFLDREFRFLRINERLASVNAKPVAAYLGLQIDEILPPDVIARVKPAFIQVRDTGKAIHNFEFDATSPVDGTRRWWNINCAPVLGSDGLVSGLQIVVLDVTERYEASRALAVANEELRRVNDDLSQFAYIAAHDLQEPLRTVVTFSQLLNRRCSAQLDTESNRQLGFIVKAGLRMSQLIADVLAYSRMGFEDLHDPEPVDLNKVVSAACDELSTVVRESGCTVQCNPLPVVRGHARPLQQLLINLMGNAIKYRKADVRPSIAIHAVAELSGMWCVTVADNGQGFQQDYADRIFGIFRRLHGKDVPGSGIGLAICKRVVEQHGGRIWAEGEAGVGARFHFTLPAAQSDLPVLSHHPDRALSQSPLQ